MKKGLLKGSSVMLKLAAATSVMLFADAAMAVGIGDIGENIKNQGAGVQSAIEMIAVVAGIFFVVASLFMANAASKPQSQVQWKTVIGSFFIGILLLSLSTVINVGATSTLGGVSERNITGGYNG